MSSTVSGTQMLNKAVISMIVTASGCRNQRAGLNVRGMTLPKPDVDNAQGSLNLDAKTGSVSAPYPKHPER